MGRSGLAGFAVLVAVLFLIAGLAGCSNNGAVHTTNFAVPASVTLSPGPNFSMEIGTNQAFTAAALTAANAAATQPMSFQSSNPAVLTVATNGLACAGSWNSLSSPQVCTPGPTGVAEVTASAQGVSSPPTTVYVHQHIDNITVKLFVLPNQPPPTNSCFSIGQTANYQATAYSNGVNITSTVGIFNWQTLVANVATLNTSDPALFPGQVLATAKLPGLTSIFATIGNANSVPVSFTTCPVQSITLAVTNSTSTSRTIVPTIIDSIGTTITGVPLTWSSSESAAVSVTSSGAATASTGGGGATIIASCTPPTCNAGILPSLPIYPENVVNLFVAPSGTTPTTTVYVSTTSCGTIDGCFSTVAPIAVPANTLGNFITLPVTPNSLVFNRQGTNAYLGTDSGQLGSVGLAVLDSVGRELEKAKV